MQNVIFITENIQVENLALLSKEAGKACNTVTKNDSDIRDEIVLKELVMEILRETKSTV